MPRRAPGKVCSLMSRLGVKEVAVTSRNTESPEWPEHRTAKSCPGPREGGQEGEQCHRSWIGIWRRADLDKIPMEQVGEGEQGSRGSPEGSLEAGKSVRPEVGGPGTDPGPPSLLPEAYGEKLLTTGPRASGDLGGAVRSQRRTDKQVLRGAADPELPDTAKLLVTDVEISCHGSSGELEAWRYRSPASP